MSNQPFHIFLLDTFVSNYCELKEKGFADVKAPFVGQTQARSIAAALENDLKGCSDKDGTRIALAFKGGQMDDQGIIWPEPVEGEYVLGTVDWRRLDDGTVKQSFTPYFDEEVQPAGAALDAQMAKVEASAEEAIQAITRRVNGVKAFRKILRTRNPRRMLDLLLAPSEDPEDLAASQILIGMGLLTILTEGEAEGSINLTPAGLEVVEIGNSIARNGPVDAAEEIMAGNDEIELDHA
jgi:hypothetical protein